MSDETPKSSGPFDVETVRSLFELMDQFDVNEVDLRDSNKRIHLRRGVPAGPIAPAPMMPAAYPYPIQPATTANAPSVAPIADNTPPAKKLLEIKSEMVGTFYAKPAPDKEEYVKVGSKVTPDTVVGKIEAMKIYNDYTAKCTGTIVEIVIQNGEPVEFDTVLFRVDPG